MPFSFPRRFRLLVIGIDEPTIQLTDRLAGPAGFDVEVCRQSGAALDALLRRPAEAALIVQDAEPGEDDDLLKRFKRTLPGCEVIVVTPCGNVEDAVRVMKAGAFDYLPAPLDARRLGLAFVRLRDELKRRADGAAVALSGKRPHFLGMLGRSRAMQEVFRDIERLAPHSRMAIITGESGTGKDLAARAFHQSGPRRTRPLVRVHGSAFDERALADASGATLCIDEIGDLTPEGQLLLLRALEQEKAWRHTHPFEEHDLAIIATSRRDLRSEVQAGRFRDDLFYRLNAVEIPLPPLRERRDDIPLLTAAFLRDVATRLRRPAVALSLQAERLLAKAPWPGNVRELKQTVERASLLADGAILSEDTCRLAMRPREPPVDAAGAWRASQAGNEPGREQILAVLDHVQGNRLAAAKVLGISRRSLYRRLERYQIGAEAPPRRAYRQRPR